MAVHVAARCLPGLKKKSSIFILPPDFHVGMPPLLVEFFPLKEPVPCIHNHTQADANASWLFKGSNQLLEADSPLPPRTAGSAHQSERVAVCCSFQYALTNNKMQVWVMKCELAAPSGSALALPWPAAVRSRPGFVTGLLWNFGPKARGCGSASAAADARECRSCRPPACTLTAAVHASATAGSR